MPEFRANDATRLLGWGHWRCGGALWGTSHTPAERFRQTGAPRDLTAVSVVGVGDRISLGADHLGQEGLTRRSITSALVDSPSLMKMAAANKIESYTFPQGVLSQLMRDMAGGRPGLITKTGLHTFVDPRQQGARQSECPRPFGLSAQGLTWPPPVLPEPTVTWLSMRPRLESAVREVCLVQCHRFRRPSQWVKLMSQNMGLT